MNENKRGRYARVTRKDWVVVIDVRYSKLDRCCCDPRWCPVIRSPQGEVVLLGPFEIQRSSENHKDVS
jgi:hypothetical protein